MLDVARQKLANWAELSVACSESLSYDDNTFDIVVSTVHILRHNGVKKCKELLTIAGFVEVNIEQYKINWLWGVR